MIKKPEYVSTYVSREQGVTKTIQFRCHNGCITTLQCVRHIPELSYNPISLGALHEEGFNFSSVGDLMKVFKYAHLKFQAEHIDNIYML